MSDPLVSICSVSFNHEKTLSTYFDSIVAQTYRPIEVILIEDASEDNTRAVISTEIRKLSKAQIPYKVCHNGTTSGIRDCFEWVTREARGEFICLLDTCDWIFPARIEENVKFLLANPDFAGVYSDFHMAEDDGTTKKDYCRLTKRKPAFPATVGEILEKGLIMTCTLTLRRDWQNGKIGYIDKSLAVYRNRPVRNLDCLDLFKRDGVLA